jgi:hypothetical protein
MESRINPALNLEKTSDVMYLLLEKMSLALHNEIIKAVNKKFKTSWSLLSTPDVTAEISKEYDVLSQSILVAPKPETVASVVQSSSQNTTSWLGNWFTTSAPATATATATAKRPQMPLPKKQILVIDAAHIILKDDNKYAKYLGELVKKIPGYDPNVELSLDQLSLLRQDYLAKFVKDDTLHIDLQRAELKRQQEAKDKEEQEETRIALVLDEEKIKLEEKKLSEKHEAVKNEVYDIMDNFLAGQEQVNATKAARSASAVVVAKTPLVPDAPPLIGQAILEAEARARREEALQDGRNRTAAIAQQKLAPMPTQTPPSTPLAASAEIKAKEMVAPTAAVIAPDFNASKSADSFKKPVVSLAEFLQKNGTFKSEEKPVDPEVLALTQRKFNLNSSF